VALLLSFLLFLFRLPGWSQRDPGFPYQILGNSIHGDKVVQLRFFERWEFHTSQEKEISSLHISHVLNMSTFFHVSYAHLTSVSDISGTFNWSVSFSFFHGILSGTLIMVDQNPPGFWLFVITSTDSIPLLVSDLPKIVLAHFADAEFFLRIDSALCNYCMAVNFFFLTMSTL
jgi:hypothetical protein